VKQVAAESPGPVRAGEGEHHVAARPGLCSGSDFKQTPRFAHHGFSRDVEKLVQRIG
jgi:hypothetical protein